MQLLLRYSKNNFAVLFIFYQTVLLAEVVTLTWLMSVVEKLWFVEYWMSDLIKLNAKLTNSNNISSYAENSLSFCFILSNIFKDLVIFLTKNIDLIK